MMTTDQMNAAARRLRKVANDSGFDFRKSRKTISADNLGGYMLTEIKTNAVVSGARYQLDIKDVAKELQRLHVLGYGK